MLVLCAFRSLTRQVFDHKRTILSVANLAHFFFFKSLFRFTYGAPCSVAFVALLWHCAHAHGVYYVLRVGCVACPPPPKRGAVGRIHLNRVDRLMDSERWWRNSSYYMRFCSCTRALCLHFSYYVHDHDCPSP